jgi:phosphonate transport system permease protein
VTDRLQLAVDPAILGRYPQLTRGLGARRVRAVLLLLAAFALLVFSAWRLDFDPSRIVSGLRQLVWFVALMLPPSPGDQLWLYLDALAQTVAIAFLGTAVASCFAFVFGFLAAANVLPVWIVRFLLRRAFDTIRGVDVLIWALLWINVVGLGPFAGVLAIACSDFGALAKLFSEAIEALDSRASVGVRASGGTRLAEIRFGLLPQVLPVIAGQMLYFFESNTRSATIIGIVGAGGIGLHLAEQIRTFEWQHVCFIVILVLIAVAIIDFVSSRLRAAMSGQRRS